jgi:hypothetical protein
MPAAKTGNATKLWEEKGKSMENTNEANIQRRPGRGREGVSGKRKKYILFKNLLEKQCAKTQLPSIFHKTPFMVNPVRLVKCLNQFCLFQGEDFGDIPVVRR